MSGRDTRSASLPKLLLLLCRSAFGGVAFDEFVGHYSDEDDDAEDGVFEVGGNAEHVDGIVNEPDDRRRNDDAEDAAFAAAELFHALRANYSHPARRRRWRRVHKIRRSAPVVRNPIQRQKAIR